MDKLNKIGLTALAGVFATASAQAADVSVSGGASVNFATDDTTEVTGNKLSMGDSLTFTVSGDSDFGTVSHSIEIDNGAQDDQTLKLDMGDNGVVFVQNSGAQGTGADLTPNAYGSASYSLVANQSAGLQGKHYADGLDSGVGSVNLGYTNSFAGFDVAVGYTAGAAANTSGDDISVNVKYADLIDGLTLSVGLADLNQDATDGINEQTISASYKINNVTIGMMDYQADDDAASGTDYDGRHYGISFQINDDFAVSYDKSSSDKSSTAVDEDVDSFQASYTMGNMKIKGHISRADNEGYSTGAEDEQKAIDISWSF
jgi:outer membrane protein OmpU